ncbi:MAG: helix-hairpin-helix domain-containing protein [Legionella sp.]
MKANIFAAALSLSVIAYSSHAITSKKSFYPKQAPVVIHKIDLNTADLTTLPGSVKGIGRKRDESIIAYRKGHNGF